VTEWVPTREDSARAADRARVRRARDGRRPLALLLLIAGPGILVMLGENDGPSMLSYATTGATYGVGFFVPFIVLTFVMAYVVQETALRIGIATHRGHAELIASRFGAVWGGFAMLDLFIGNLLTLVAEFVAVSAGAAYFGIKPAVAVSIGALLVIASMCTRRYFTWERAVMILAAANVIFVPAAFFAHPDPAAIGRALGTWVPLPGGPNARFLMLALANIGATVTPWMLFFQQSAVVDKGLTRADLRLGRIDTAAGASVAAIVAIAAVVATAPLFVHHADVASFAGGADFATALRPYLGSTGATLFALGMIEAGLVAAMTISTSSAYGVGEVLRRGHSLNLPFSQGVLFYGISIASTVIAGAVVLVPHAPLLAITLTVNVIATLLMAPALIFVLILANDREIMGKLANGLRANLAGGAIVTGISLVGAVYAVMLVVQEFGAK
jgi:Mn2+/Fe2+ NRAMP family transporter